MGGVNMARELHPTETVKESRVNGRGIWLRSISTDIGELFVIEHEDQAYEIITDGLFRDDPERAEKTYTKTLRKMA